MLPIDRLRLLSLWFLLSRYSVEHDQLINSLSYSCRSNHSVLTINSTTSLSVSFAQVFTYRGLSSQLIITRILALLHRLCSTASVYLDSDVINITDFSFSSNPPFPIDHTKSYFIGRLGCRGAETVSSFLSHSSQLDLLFDTNSPYHKYLSMLKTNCGIFPLNYCSVSDYTSLYLDAISNSTHLRSFPIGFLPELYLSSLSSSFSYSDHLWDSRAWIYYFSDTRILIVSPFVDEIKSQLSSGRLSLALSVDNLFNTCEFSYVKVPILNGLVEPSASSWRDVYLSLCDDISIQSDKFELAFVSAGGYGMPLSNFIYSQLDKSVIYLGGNLQCWFGILGNRWKNVNAWSSLWNEYWISPSNQPPGSSIIDNNCYWI